MCRHVVWSLVGMLEESVAVRHQSAHECLEIAAYTWVGILAEDQRGAGMMHEEMTEAGLDPAGAGLLSHRGGDVVGAAARVFRVMES